MPYHRDLAHGNAGREDGLATAIEARRVRLPGVVPPAKEAKEGQYE
jgi:hypothetical protein